MRSCNAFFPMQSLSISGKQEGIKKGTESGLLLEVKRLLKNEAKNGKLPEWLLMEKRQEPCIKKIYIPVSEMA